MMIMDLGGVFLSVRNTRRTVVRRVLLPLDELDHDAFGPEDESEAQARVVEICDPNGFTSSLGNGSGKQMPFIHGWVCDPLFCRR